MAPPRRSARATKPLRPRLVAGNPNRRERVVRVYGGVARAGQLRSELDIAQFFHPARRTASHRAVCESSRSTTFGTLTSLNLAFNILGCAVKTKAALEANTSIGAVCHPRGVAGGGGNGELTSDSASHAGKAGSTCRFLPFCFERADETRTAYSYPGSNGGATLHSLDKEKGALTRRAAPSGVRTAEHRITRHYLFTSIVTVRSTVRLPSLVVDSSSRCQQDCQLRGRTGL